MKKVFPALLAVLAVMLVAPYAHAADAGNSLLPTFSVSVGEKAGSEGGTVTTALKIVFLMTLLTFAPAMVVCMTSFTRISVVLGMTRTALGTQSMPPNTVITGLALFLTISIMQPVFQQMYADGIQPYMDGQMGEQEAWTKATGPLKEFLVSHSREKDLALFLEITKNELPEDPKSVPLQVAVPSFVLSELNMAFQIGFLIALPFLVLDMVVSSVLTSMSMITLPPVVISLPLKMMLFVVVDGWHLIIDSLVRTYQ